MAPPGLEKKTSLQIASGEDTIPPVMVVHQGTGEECDAAATSSGHQVGAVAPQAEDRRALEGESGRERLKRHRSEMAGKVWVPETWGHETLLRDWKDCSVIDRSLFPAGLMTAREALVEECRRATSAPVRMANSC